MHVPVTLSKIVFVGPILSSNLSYLSLPLCSPNLGPIDFCREFQTCESFVDMGLQRAHENHHERLRISTKRELQKICQLIEQSA